MIKSLKDCLALSIDRRGVTPKKLGSDWSESGYRVLSANNIKTVGIQNSEEIRYVDKETYKKWMKEEIQRGDIILTSEAPAGEVIYWDSDEKIVAGQRVYILRTTDDVDALFLKYYIQSEKGQAEIRNKCSGSTVFGISAKMFEYIEIVLPEQLTIQKKISSLLYSLDKKIEINNAINNELGIMARTIYDYWFLQFDFPDENGRPYKSSGGRMVWNEELKREIPEGWKIDEIGDYIKSQRGISYNSATIGTEGVPMINLASFNTNGTYKTSGIKTYSGVYEQGKVLKPYDLLMCNTQQTAIDFKKDIIGKAILVPDIFEGDIVSSHHVTAIKVNSDEMKYYLYYLFNTEFFHKYIAGYTNGTNILGLLFDGVEKYKVTIPCKSILKKYANIAKDIEQQKSKIIKENQELSSLRDFLLPLLMNGQVGFKEC